MKNSIPDPNMAPLLQRIGHLAAERRLTAYAVGGCVRDWLLGSRQLVDVDITVQRDGIALAQAVAQALRGRLTIHQQFRTATLMAQDVRIDFATCRKESYTEPAAYPRVRPGTLRDDLYRRDFTINAMAMALHPGQFGRLVDPFGGARDLRRKVLRSLHAKSFMDDPSRILRGIRFAQRFELRWDPVTKRQAKAAIRAGALGWLNAGRMRKEMDHMLKEPNPRRCLHMLAELLNPAVQRS